MGLDFYSVWGQDQGILKSSALSKTKMHHGLCFTKDKFVIVTSNFDISTPKIMASDSVEMIPLFSLC